MTTLKPLKMFIDEPSFDLEYLVEEKNKNEAATLYIRGPYLMSEKKNKNGRIYNLNEMIGEVERYSTEMIKNGRALGELNHPTSVEVNPERSCHMITELKQDGNIFVGKSKILSTPTGQIVRSLILDGVKLGISSRALGKLLPTGDAHAVQGFHLICCDVVHDPSVNDAFVNGIMESKEWIVSRNGAIMEAYEGFEKGLEHLPNRGNEREAAISTEILKFINALKGKK